MEDSLKPKTLLSQEMFSLFLPKTEEKNNVESDSRISYEVFRNKTTAVEVIVKEVPNNNKRVTDDKLVRKLEANVGKLESEVQKANIKLQSTRDNFNVFIKELKRQVDDANKRELSSETERLVLQLENEKLKMLLETKTNLLKKLKNEINNMKRVMKYLLKGVCFAHKEQESGHLSSNSEYQEFERSLKKTNVKFPQDVLDKTGGTYDTTNTDDNMNSMVLVM